MSHNIHVEKGKAAIMWTGEPPWHGLGQELAGPATAEQAIQAAGLDWEVGVQPVYAQGGSHSLRVPRAFAVVPLHRWGEAACPLLLAAGLGGGRVRCLQLVLSCRHEMAGRVDSVHGPRDSARARPHTPPEGCQTQAEPQSGDSGRTDHGDRRAQTES